MEGLEILQPTVILLGLGFFVIYICRLIRISPIIGFLFGGILLGPHGLELIAETKITHFLAELGVVFLLFDIGLHFSTKSAWSLRRDLFVLAPLQFFLSGLVLGTSISIIFGVSADMSILIGLTLALSSTAVVMQMVSDLKQTESPVGQSAKSVLIFQDIAAIFLLIFADTLGSGDSLAYILSSTFLKTIAAFAAAVLLGKYILSPLLKSITKYNDPEMFTVLGLLIVMVTGLATASVGLSITLGAFLAGMVLAETPFRVLLQTELRPFRSLLLALFFINVGMVMNPEMVWNEGAVILGLATLIIAAKAALICALVFVLKRPMLHTLQLTFLLAQGSEFAFVIFSMATFKSVMGITFANELIAAVAISMLFTPLLSTFAHRWALKLCSKIPDTICNAPKQPARDPKINQPVLIAGMNEVGKTLARAFRALNIPYLAVDHDRQRFLEATAAGYVVAYGRGDDLRFWNTLGVARALAICIATPRYETAQRLTPIVKRLYPHLKRYVAVNDSADGVRFAALGLIPFHNKGAPPGLEMASSILRELGISEENIQAWEDDEQSAFLNSNKMKDLEEKPVLAAAE